MISRSFLERPMHLCRHDDLVGTVRRIAEGNILATAMKNHGNLKQKTLPASETMNLFHAVKNLQAQIFHDPDMALAALVTLGDISGRGEDIFVEIVTSPDDAFS